MSQSRAFRLGISGPIGAGKTSLIEHLSRTLLGQRTVAAIVNEVYNREDTDYLLAHKVLPCHRIKSVLTGQCTQQEIVDRNLAAADDLQAATRRLDLILIESVGDFVANSFRAEIADAWIYMIDVAGGDKTPRKGSPGISRSDMLVVNKIDLAAMVNVSLRNMERECRALRGDLPMVFTNLRCSHGVIHIADWLERISDRSASSDHAAAIPAMQPALSA